MKKHNDASNEKKKRKQKDGKKVKETVQKK